MLGTAIPSGLSASNNEVTYSNYPFNKFRQSRLIAFLFFFITVLAFTKDLTICCGGYRIRTDDPLLAKQVL